MPVHRWAIGPLLNRIRCYVCCIKCIIKFYSIMSNFYIGNGRDRLGFRYKNWMLSWAFTWSVWIITDPATCATCKSRKSCGCEPDNRLKCHSAGLQNCL